MRKGLKEDIEKTIMTELKAANESFPAFNSTHEGYAVILEEAQEAEEELKAIASGLNELWERTKKNASEDQLEEVTQFIEQHAAAMAAEATQTAAMARKHMQYLQSRRTLKEAGKDAGQTAAGQVLQEA